MGKILAIICGLLFISLLFVPIPINQRIENVQNKRMESISAFATSEKYEGELPGPTPVALEPTRVVLPNPPDPELGEGEIPEKIILKNSSFLSAFAAAPESESKADAPIQPLSQEIIDSDIVSGEKLKLEVTLYKDTGEIDDEHDYYVVKVLLENLYTKNDFWQGILFSDVWIFFPDWVEVSKHEPQAGFRWSQTSVGFSYQGIGISLNLPAYSVGYEVTNKYSGWKTVHWQLDGCIGKITEGVTFWAWWVFGDTAEFAVGIRVPEGQKPYAYVAGWAAWYQFTVIWYFGFWPVMSYKADEMVYWGYVDPPEVQSHPEPPVPPPRDSAPELKGPKQGEVDGMPYIE